MSPSAESFQAPAPWLVPKVQGGYLEGQGAYSAKTEPEVGSIQLEIFLALNKLTTRVVTFPQSR